MKRTKIPLHNYNKPKLHTMTTTNHITKQLIAELKQTARKENAKIWRRIAVDLEKPTRQRRKVNVYKISKIAQDGEVVIVPGKVLGTGDISHKVTVAAHTFSRQAVEKINNAGGKVLKINDIMKQNPKGKNVRILG
jgi:large subunit ribosomal protein L18e